MCETVSWVGGSRWSPMIEGLICSVDRLPSNIAEDIYYLPSVGRRPLMPTSQRLLNNAFADLKKERLALSKEHLNLRARRYLSAWAAPLGSVRRLSYDWNSCRCSSSTWSYIVQLVQFSLLIPGCELMWCNCELMLSCFVVECLKTCMEGYYISAPCGPDHNTVCKRKCQCINVLPDLSSASALNPDIIEMEINLAAYWHSKLAANTS